MKNSVTLAAFPNARREFAAYCHHCRTPLLRGQARRAALKWDSRKRLVCRDTTDCYNRRGEHISEREV